MEVGRKGEREGGTREEGGREGGRDKGGGRKREWEGEEMDKMK